MSDDAVAVLQLMIQYDPDVRVNVKRLLDHRFFRTLREDDLIQKFKYHVKDYVNDSLNRNKGDFHTVYRSSSQGKRSKYKSSSSISDRSEKRKSGLKLVSKTHVDITDYKPHIQLTHNLRANHAPLVDQQKIKSWGINPNILKPRDDKKKHEQEYKKHLLQKPLPQHRSKQTYSTDSQGFSKTTSNLPQISHLGNTKATHFQSKSFILPSRQIGQGSELPLHRTHQQVTNKKHSKPTGRNS